MKQDHGEQQTSGTVLDALGYTDHSIAHTKLVADRAADLLKAFNYMCTTV